MHRSFGSGMRQRGPVWVSDIYLPSGRLPFTKHYWLAISGCCQGRLGSMVWEIRMATGRVWFGWNVWAPKTKTRTWNPNPPRTLIRVRIYPQNQNLRVPEIRWIIQNPSRGMRSGGQELQSLPTSGRRNWVLTPFTGQHTNALGRAVWGEARCSASCEERLWHLWCLNS